MLIILMLLMFFLLKVCMPSTTKARSSYYLLLSFLDKKDRFICALLRVGKTIKFLSLREPTILSLEPLILSCSFALNLLLFMKFMKSFLQFYNIE